jgi:hypothetical protein
MRLVMLGKADCQPTDARPSIVVLCLKEQRNRVKKFFERRDARDLYRPWGGDPDLPIFDFHIGPPPRLRGWDHGVEVLTDTNIHQVLCPTLCGTPIHLKHSETGLVRTATLGGIVTVADATNQVVCCGITAGHVIPAVHDAMKHHSGAAPISWNTGEGQIIGTVVDECLKQRESEDGRYYDWALCRLSHHFLAPNCLRPQGDNNPTQHGEEHSAGRWAKLHTVDSSFRDAVDDIGVVVMTGSGGPKKGWLSTLPCPVMLGPGTEFITAFTVSFSEIGKLGFFRWLGS